MLSDDGIANNNLDYRRTESVEYITYGVDQFRIRHDISLSGRFIIVVCRDGVRPCCTHTLHTERKTQRLVELSARQTISVRSCVRLRFV